MSEQSRDPSTSEWHMDKRVNVTHLLATIGLAASVFWWGAKLEERVALMEMRQRAVLDRVQRSESRYQSEMGRIDRRFDRVDEMLVRIDDKLDQKVDK